MKISALFANKRTRVITISVAAVVLVLAILTPILLYAGGYIMPLNADGTPSERLLNTIKRDYAEYHGYCAPGDVTILYCGGYYNGCVPFYQCNSKTGYMCVLTEERIGGVLFTYSDSNTLFIWKFGKVYTVSEAYDRGWLNRDDLLKIRDDYYAYEKGER